MPDINNNDQPIPSQPTYKALTVRDIASLRAAYVKLAENLSSKLTTPTKDAEVKGLKEYIANTMLVHADEFLGAWITLNREYQPMLMGLSGLFARVQDIIRRSEAEANAVSSDTNPVSNTIPLIQP